jgi:hypothetical protein
VAAAWALLGLIQPFFTNPALHPAASPDDLAGALVDIFLHGIAADSTLP